MLRRWHEGRWHEGSRLRAGDLTAVSWAEIDGVSPPASSGPSSAPAFPQPPARLLASPYLVRAGELASVSVGGRVYWARVADDPHFGLHFVLTGPAPMAVASFTFGETMGETMAEGAR